MLSTLRRTTLFPYTTLFRSILAHEGATLATAILPPPHPPRKRFENCIDNAAKLASHNDVMASWDVPPSASHLLRTQDRKSTRLNSSHGYISYAVFCLKKKTL